MSPSSRRAWIEIVKMDGHTAGTSVALLAEGVDRNVTAFSLRSRCGVALLAEGVDRNFADPAIRAAYLVALLAVGVGRKLDELNKTGAKKTPGPLTGVHA